MDTSDEKAQKRFGGIRDDQSQIDSRNLNDNTFNEEMRDNNISAGKRFVNYSDGIRDSFKIDGGTRDKRRTITGYGLYTENCDFSQNGSGQFFFTLTGAGLRQR